MYIKARANEFCANLWCKTELLKSIIIEHIRVGENANYNLRVFNSDKLN